MKLEKEYLLRQTILEFMAENELFDEAKYYFTDGLQMSVNLSETQQIKILQVYHGSPQLTMYVSVLSKICTETISENDVLEAIAKYVFGLDVVSARLLLQQGMHLENYLDNR